MALGRCRQCGKVASSKAEVCPYCRARTPVRPAIVRPAPDHVRKTRPGKALKVGLGVSAAAMLAAFAGLLLPERSPMTLTAPVARVAPQSSGTSGADRRPEHAIDLYRITTITTIASSVRRSLVHPESVIWESILSDDNASVVCLEYVTRNADNAAVRGRITYVRGKVTERADDWGIHCAARTLSEVTHLVPGV
jgi:hypothetical protein